MLIQRVASGRFLTALLVLLLLALNILVIAERRTAATGPFSQLTSPPRIGTSLRPYQYKLITGEVVELPSRAHRASVIYLSGSDPISLGEIALLDAITRTDIGRKARIAWVDLGFESYEPVIDLPGLRISVVDGSRAVLRRLGLSDPVQGTVIILAGDRITYEGRVQKAHLAHQIADAGGLDINLDTAFPSAGADIMGVLMGRRGPVVLQETSDPIVLLLYAGYCGLCGENELYKLLRLSTDIEVYSVFPGIEGDSGVRDVISTLNADMDFHTLSIGETTLDLGAFLYADPGLLVVEGGRVMYAARRTDSIAEIVRSVRALAAASGRPGNSTGHRNPSMDNATGGHDEHNRTWFAQVGRGSSERDSDTPESDDSTGYSGCGSGW